MVETLNDVEDIEGTSSESSSAQSDVSDEPMSAEDDKLHLEEPLTEKEVEDLIAEFLEVESKAAEAQEALEKESLAKVEADVREELAQNLHGDELEAAVADEMTTLREEWEDVLDKLETESALLLEQLDGAGVDLPTLYRSIESQVPNGCCTEAWKQRAHWVGSQVTGELTDSISEAEKYLQTHRPVRRRNGKLLEEGASGFLRKKLASDGSKEGEGGNTEVDWDSFNKRICDGASEGDTSFGSKHWGAVYFASTPQQAAMMGLKFPGVNEVEEIDDVDGSTSDPFVAAAIANEKELVLSEDLKNNFRKVKEEDDANIDRKLQQRLKRRRERKRHKQKANQKETSSVYSESNFEEHLAVDDHSDANTVDHRNEGKGVPHDDKVIEDGSTTKKQGSPEASGYDAEQPPIDGGLTGRKRSYEMTGKYDCTACGKVAIEVQSHPFLKVIICQSCRYLIEERMKMKDAACSECFCGWCGQTNGLVRCKSCEMLFCTACIKRNIGESEVHALGWQCFCCSPSLLQRLNLEFKKAADVGDLVASTSDSDSDNSDSDNSGVDIGVAISNNRRRKKKIRRILDDAELGEETKRKIAIEKERQEHLNSLKVQFSASSVTKSITSCNGILSEDASTEVLGDASRGYIVNVVREKSEEAVRIPPSISAKLKAHQVAGIRFMWENIVQSITKVKSGDRGLGCILAHTMGLGKTFQVIAFLYTAMRSVDLGLRTALIVTPVNVLHNWRQEFIKWRPSEVKPLRVFMLEDVARERRSELLAKWRTKGGVFLIGYTAFRNLSLGKHVKERHVAREICCALQDGPDILVCDEAHMIKNTRADTTQALKQVKCQRRIALTGSPLQNNLMEYYCMVDFVREGFLGSSQEFRNRFQNPIENGQHTNSTWEDVKIMNQRSHILYKQLKGFVQRMDMSVVKKDLPPKTVYVIAVKLSPLQRRLYKRFLDVHGFTNDRVSSEGIRKSFFAGYQALAQIWNHPGILQLRKEEREYSKRDDTIDNCLADDISSDENVDYNVVIGEKSKNSGSGFFQKGWWNDLLRENDYKELEYSGKIVLLLDILTASSEVGDKTLIFSQSIPTLDLIELYLSKLPRNREGGKLWKKNKDWYRFDGRTESSERQRLVERFNDPRNRRVKCTLISTRAGSLGINLHAANRVIIVDGSWNPTYDLQAIYRAWRYGQTKPVFAYRLMAHGTMEEKIYKRQVTKEGLAARVVDRQQVHRTISKEEMLHLFEFGDDENPDTASEFGHETGHANNQHIGHSMKPDVPLSHGNCSSDKLMENLLSKHYPRWIANYHEHETLLQENEEEKLSKEEQDMAWEVYCKSLQWEEVQRASVDNSASDQKTAVTNSNHVPQASSLPDQGMPDIVPSAPKSSCIIRSKRRIRNYVPRKCTNLSHLLTLRSQGTKVGCCTVCGECARVISWEGLNKDGRSGK